MSALLLRRLREAFKFYWISPGQGRGTIKGIGSKENAGGEIFYTTSHTTSPLFVFLLPLFFFPPDWDFCEVKVSLGIYFKPLAFALLQEEVLLQRIFLRYSAPENPFGIPEEL